MPAKWDRPTKREPKREAPLEKWRRSPFNPEGVYPRDTCTFCAQQFSRRNKAIAMFLVVPLDQTWEVLVPFHAGCVGFFLMTQPQLNAQYAGELEDDSARAI